MIMVVLLPTACKLQVLLAHREMIIKRLRSSKVVRICMYALSGKKTVYRFLYTALINLNIFS